MTVEITGTTPSTNEPRKLTIKLQGEEVHVAVHPPNGNGYLVRVPRDVFVAELNPFLLACAPSVAAPTDAS